MFENGYCIIEYKNTLTDSYWLPLVNGEAMKLPKNYSAFEQFDKVAEDTLVTTVEDFTFSTNRLLKEYRVEVVKILKPSEYTKALKHTKKVSSLYLLLEGLLETSNILCRIIIWMELKHLSKKAIF